ncbi:MAG: nitronate monooxygenase family protein [Desulfobacterales bacterium]|nr:nitronate monooxygenase family protein [Desulfobacterales bacterium]
MQLPPLKIGDKLSRLPIVQGGMGVGISMSGLASAVAEQGGVGVISAAMPGIQEPDIAKNGQEANIRVLRREIRKARQKTGGVIGVNVMVALTNFEDMVLTSAAEGADVIFAGAGLPLSLPGLLPEGSRTRLAPIVSSARAARIICQKWKSRFDVLPDAIVVEGPMAGGHLGFTKDQIEDPAFALEKLVVEVIESVREFREGGADPIPVIAAGGIFTGKDIHRFLSLGASAAQMGTRFVATHECDADDGFKQVYLNAREEDLIIIESPVGMPGRVVRNAFIEEVNQGRKKPFACPFHCIKTCNPSKSPYCIARALSNARKGRFENGFAFAGQNAHRVRKIVSVKELMDTLVWEYGQSAAAKAA